MNLVYLSSKGIEFSKNLLHKCLLQQEEANIHDHQYKELISEKTSLVSLNQEYENKNELLTKKVKSLENKCKIIEARSKT